MPPQPTPTAKSDKEQRTFEPSYTLNKTAISVLVPVTPSHKGHLSRTVSSSSRSRATVLLGNGKKKTSPKKPNKKQNMYIILACGAGGAIFLVMVIALTVVIYLKR